MTARDIAPTPLVFNGEIIRDKPDTLCLTDMWKAGGSDPSRAPAEWLRSAEAQRFIAFLGETLNMGNSHIELVKTTRGGKSPGTWAHWQVGLAYAKYLSPEFHMWGNQVVRERMEGKTAPAIGAGTLEQIERSFGIMRMLSHKVTEMEKAFEAIPTLVTAVGQLAAIVQPSVPGLVIRQGKTAGTLLRGAGFTNSPKGLAVRVGNWLEAAGCRVSGRVETGTSRSRLFDPDKVEAWFKAGGRAAVERELAERRGQGALALRGGYLTTRELIREAAFLDEGQAIVQTPGAFHIIDTREFALDGKTDAAVLDWEGRMRIDKPTPYDGNRFCGERSGLSAPYDTPKRKSVQDGVVVLGKVLASREIRPRPVLVSG
jgi:hypothetical protein